MLTDDDDFGNKQYQHFRLTYITCFLNLQLTENTFSLLLELWNAHLDEFIHHAQMKDHHNMTILLELSTLALKG